MSTRYVVTPDGRMPFDNQKALKTAMGFIGGYRPDYAIQGDGHLMYLNLAFGSWLARLAPTRTHPLLPVPGSSIYLGLGLGYLLSGPVVARFGLTVLSPIAGLVYRCGMRGTSKPTRTCCPARRPLRKRSWTQCPAAGQPFQRDNGLMR
jgi:hypothetical protein